MEGERERRESYSAFNLQVYNIILKHYKYFTKHNYTIAELMQLRLSSVYSVIYFTLQLLTLQGLLSPHVTYLAASE